MRQRHAVYEWEVTRQDGEVKVVVDRKALADATRAVGKFLPRLSSIPVLNHFLVEAHSGIIAITAHDHESGRRVELEAEVEGAGDILVPAAFASPGE